MQKVIQSKYWADSEFWFYFIYFTQFFFLSLILYEFSIIPTFSDIYLKVDRICLNMELEST